MYIKEKVQRYEVFNKKNIFFLNLEDGSNYFLEIYCALIVTNKLKFLAIEKFWYHQWHTGDYSYHFFFYQKPDLNNNRFLKNIIFLLNISCISRTKPFMTKVYINFSS